MALRALAILALVAINDVTSLTNSDVGASTPEIIENHGYVSETHHVTTEDGYIVTMHRIPHGINDTGIEKRPAVFIMHGIIMSSAEDVELGPERGLAFLLADAGYDVWLGNARGNHYSRNHTSLDVITDAEKFFNFSWHEMGVYDLPACIDYILDINGDENLFYIGTSQGTTLFFVMTSTKPEYNAKIKLASLMAPAALMSHKPDTNFLKVVCKYIDRVEALLKKYKIFEIPVVDAIRANAPTACLDPQFKGLCEMIFAMVAGNEEDAEYNKDLISVFLSNVPSNAGLKQYIHFGQQIKNGGFSWFDYGAEKNIEVYGTERPPAYDFSKITTPVAFYYAKNDGLIPYEDDVTLISLLPNVVKDYLIPSDRYKHISVGLAKDVVELVYNPLMQLMKNYK